MRLRRAPDPKLLAALALAAGTGLSAQVAAPSPLTTAKAIAAHFTPEKTDPVPVMLEATVTFQDPGLTIFLQDDTGATFIRGAKDNPEVTHGERLRIEGVTHNGLILGGIKPLHVERLGTGVTVPAREVTPDDLFSGRFHYHWVTLNGVVRSVRRDDENQATVRLITQGQTVEVRFDEAPSASLPLVDAEVRVRGLAAGDINDRRQLVQPYVRVSSSADMEVLRQPPDDPFSIEETPLADLQRASGSAHRVKIRGVALAEPTAGGVFLREGERSVFVQTNLLDVKPGDVVEALGFPEMGVFSAQLSDAEGRVVTSQATPAALPVEVSQLSDGCDAELITTEARVLQRLDLATHTELAAQAGIVNLTIHLPGPAPGEVRADSLIRFTGLCRVTATRSNGYRARPIAYHVWLRGADDLVLLQRAPWWTSQRLGLVSGGVAALALIAFIWAAMLRRQVARQLAVIEAKAQREAITEERQRIAREFHDTLEQELAGLSLRLDAATPRVTDEKARSLLEQQRKLLQRLQTETRDFVWDLRDTSRTDAPLDAALHSLIEHLQVNTTTPLHFEIEGHAPKLPPLMQHHLLRIAREAVNNAVKYAQAQAIRVSLRTPSDALHLSIADDGKGFDVSSALALDGHFGIRGIKERAAKLGATLDLTSSPGKGTRVELRLAPLPGIA